jgi:hypothetical protein
MYAIGSPPIPQQVSRIGTIKKLAKISYIISNELSLKLTIMLANFCERVTTQ